jgi:hypothetical protein
MELGGHRHERLKLPQFHKLTVPLKDRTTQEGVSAGHAHCSIGPKNALASCRFFAPGQDASIMAWKDGVGPS